MLNPAIKDHDFERFSVKDSLVGQDGLESYIAIDNTTGQEVHIKFLQLAHLTTSAREQLYAALTRYAGISHPNLCKQLEFGQNGSIVYVVSRRVHGHTLGAIGYDAQRARPDAALVIADQLADALDHLHARGLTHGSVNARSIVINAAGNPALTDVGLQTDVLLAVGAQQFGPSDTGDQRRAALKDQAGLAMVIYHLLAPEYVFVKDMTRLSYGECPPLSTLRDDISPDIDEVFAQASITGFESCRDLVAAARAALSKPARTRADLAERPLTRTARATAITAGLVGIFALLVALGTLLISTPDGLRGAITALRDNTRALLMQVVR